MWLKHAIRKKQFFYLELYREPNLEPVTPKFCGIRHIDIQDFKLGKKSKQSAGEFIILENLTASFSHPCVMDLKLGNVNYDPGEHKPEKIRIRKLKLNTTTSGKHGVRLSGLRVYRPQNDSYISLKSTGWGDYLHDRRYFTDAIKFFLHNGYRLNTEVIPIFIERLEKILAALKSQKTFRFRATSLLFVYEGDLSNINILNPPKVDVRLIDFDHAVVSPEPGSEDANGVNIGVSELIDFFKQILYSSRRTLSRYELLSPKIPHTIWKGKKGSIGCEVHEK